MLGLPFVPDHVSGFRFRRGKQGLVLWEDGAVESEMGGSLDEALAQDFRCALAEVPRPVILEDGRLRGALDDHGFHLVGAREFRFRSGTLYQEARLLQAVASRANDERDLMLARQGGEEPQRPEDVLTWLQVTMTALASADAVYVLAAASLEAFTNEVLSTQFPDVFAELETDGRKPPRMKFRRMCELLGLSTTAKWFTELDAGLEGRKKIVHHHPQYHDDSRLDLEPLGTLDAPVSASAFLDALDTGFASVFGVFGVAVPKTHRPIEDSELEMMEMFGL